MLISGTSLSRRSVLKSGAATVALAGGGVALTVSPARADTATVNLQLGWLAGNNQIGEFMATKLGYYRDAGLETKIIAGGPNVNGLPLVATGRYEFGQLASSAALMQAVGSNNFPVKAFAVGVQRHPFAFFSLADNPIRSAKDMVGKRIGVQSTAIVLLRALLLKNQIDPKEVTVVTIGSDMSPLLNKQVDAATTWETNLNALQALGDKRVTLPLWDTGVKLYALLYYGKDSFLVEKADIVKRFTAATARGWAYAYANREEAIATLLDSVPGLDKAAETAAVDALFKFAVSPDTKANGWGAMSTDIWAEQLKLFADLGEFPKRIPALEEVMTQDILTATAADRPKLG